MSNILIGTLIIFSCMAYMIFLAYPIYHAIKLSEKMIDNTIPYEQHPPHPEMRILVAGDSTAVGVGARENTQSIAGRLGTQFPQADIRNIGISGARLKDLLLLLRQQKNDSYNLIVLQVGANDITHFTPYGVIRQELSETLKLSRELGTKVILLTSGDVGRARVFHWPLSSIFTSRTLSVRQIFAEESAKYQNVSYVDLYLDRSEDPFEKDLKKYYAPDSFHLTGDGYGVWYSSIQKKL